MWPKAILALTFLLSTCFVTGYVIKAEEEGGNLRIVGGQDAEEGQFPYQVSLRSSANDSEEWGQFCGASILNSKWILTAAHCLEDLSDVSAAHAVVGSILLSSGGVRHELSRVFIHEDYSVYRPFDDIALAELTDEIEFSENVQPIELGTEDVGEVDCILSGWGKLYENGPIPDNLQFIQLRSMTLADCRTYWIPEVIADTNLCTLAPEGQGICNADSGSPLVYDGKQIGIASRGWACAHGVPDIFARVSSYIDWIDRIVNA